MTDQPHRRHGDEVGERSYRGRFPALAVLVLALVGTHAAGGHWIGDFWEHAAVVRELATHPLHPRHPLLAIDAPHPLANPYALIVALLCRLTGATAVTGLATASVLNLAMLLVALRRFVRRFASEQPDAAAFYLLLFMLLLWGLDPWDYSGFYHVNVIVHTLSYPSAFALWVSLLALAWTDVRIDEGAPWSLLLVVPTCAVVLLTHPPTFLFLGAGLVATAADAQRRVRAVVVMVAALAAAAALALAWPYFPLWTLLTGVSEPNARNAVMYSTPLLRTFPALLGVVPMLVSARRSGRWRVATWMAILLAIYVFGFVSGKYIYGRVVFGMVFLLQLELARFVARRESSAAERASTSWPAWTAAVSATCVLLSLPALVKTARDLRYPSTYAEYAFLEQAVGQYDVMMMDGPSRWIAPSFGGKLVSVQNPLAFVSQREHETRRADVKRFFDAATPDVERRALLRKYHVSFVLVPRPAAADPATVPEEALRSLGGVAHADDRFLLVRVDSSAAR